jgi:hypothetical protein
MGYPANLILQGKTLLPGARLEEFQFASAAISLVPEIGVE